MVMGWLFGTIVIEEIGTGKGDEGIPLSSYV